MRELLPAPNRAALEPFVAGAAFAYSGLPGDERRGSRI
jgi:hypothetical protein